MKDNNMNKEVTVDNCKYTWNEREQGFFNSGGSCGQYGATEYKGRWCPAHINPDSYYAEAADEEYLVVEDAIRRSHSYFS